jgi:hypothetical protein
MAAIYIADMRHLQKNHLDVYEEFVLIGHSVTGTNQLFTSMWTDVALEQSINLDGGIFGISKNPAALAR